MQGLFTGPNRRFWIYQCSLWTFYFALRNSLALIQDAFLAGMPPRIAGVAGGFLITYGMWRILRKQTTGGVWGQIKLMMIMAMIGALLNYQGHWLVCYWTDANLTKVIDQYGFWEVYLHRFATVYLWDVWVFVAWGGLYLGIDYYGRFQEEKLRAMEASALAQQSQLKMLRYQLNPHFMFNTLNALSALVLIKSTNRAERMIVGLSKFLRYSLDSDPLAKVPLYQELEALSLYVGIERERFGERLKLKEEIEPAAEGCLVPSLLLQPLVENALKYAIAPSKEGGTIRLAALLRNGELMLRVADTGPGISRPVAELLQQPGIGLSNTMARLERIYGSAARMEIANLKPKGLEIVITLPAQYQEPPGTERRE